MIWLNIWIDILIFKSVNVDKFEGKQFRIRYVLINVHSKNHQFIDASHFRMCYIKQFHVHLDSKSAQHNPWNRYSTQKKDEITIIVKFYERKVKIFIIDDL